MKSRSNQNPLSRLPRWAGLPTILFLTMFLCGSVCAFDATQPPPPTRAWEEATRKFEALPPDSIESSIKTGALLATIDPVRTVPFLLPFLEKDRPLAVRMNALRALNSAALPGAAPIIERIVLDVEDDPAIRSAALGDLAKFDKARATEVGIACLRDEERQVRHTACWVLGEIGGETVIAALKDHFLTANEKGSAAYALGRTKNPEIARFVIAHTSLDELRKDCGLQQSYAGVMGEIPLAEAYGTMLTLLREGCSHARNRALTYFRAFPTAEAGADIVAQLEDRAKMLPMLRTYADVWFFANAPELTEESKDCLRRRVLVTYPEAVFDKVRIEPPGLDDDTLGAIIGATINKEPSSLSLDERKQFGAVERIADDQVLLKQSTGSAVVGYLVVRKDGKWKVAVQQLLRSICL